MWVHTPRACVEICMRTLINVCAPRFWVSSKPNLASTVPATYRIGAVGISLAVIPPLRALVLIPAPLPGRVLDIPSLAGAGEATHRVGACGINSTIPRPVHLNKILGIYKIWDENFQ